MSKPREFWIHVHLPEVGITPWDNNKVKYNKYACYDLPGGFCPNKSLHVIEKSAYDELLKESCDISLNNKELQAEAEALAETVRSLLVVNTQPRHRLHAEKQLKRWQKFKEGGE